MNTDRPGTLRVLCVDDNAMMASSLERRIELEPSMTWMGVVSDGNRAYERVLALMPDIVLMDIDIPGVDTFSVVERLAADVPEVRTLMFSGHVNSAFIDRAFDSGAWGYLSKNDDVARVIEGIRQAARGEIVLSKEVQAVQRANLDSPG